jgi:hypothetical protein
LKFENVSFWHLNGELSLGSEIRWVSLGIVRFELILSC